MQILFTPLIAFLIFLALAILIGLLGRRLAGPSKYSQLKSSTYSSGELPPTMLAAPGYRPFFVVALFFAVLHLGVLVLATGYSLTRDADLSIGFNASIAGFDSRLRGCKYE